MTTYGNTGIYSLETCKFLSLQDNILIGGLGSCYFAGSTIYNDGYMEVDVITDFTTEEDDIDPSVVCNSEEGTGSGHAFAKFLGNAESHFSTSCPDTSGIDVDIYIEYNQNRRPEGSM